MKYLSLIIVSFFFLSLTAQTPDSLQAKQKKIYHLEGTSIVAEKPVQAIGKIEIKNWDEREIDRETNIADALSLMPGINIAKGGKSSSELSIRGFEKEDVMIMLDGRPIGGGYFDAVDLSALPLSDLKEIQVIKGPASALYGSNTMGGVVNIVSKKPDNQSWLKANILFQRNNTNRFMISSAHSLSAFDYRLSLARYHTDGFPLSNDFVPTAIENGGIRDHSAQSQYDLQSQINFPIYDLHQISLNASFSWMDERQIPPDIYYAEEYRRYVDWKRYQLSASGIFFPGYRQKLNINLYYDGYDDIYQTFSDPEYTVLKLNSQLLSWNIGAIAKYTWENDYLKLIAGYRTERQAYNRKDNKSYSEWTSNWQLMQNPFLQLEFELAPFTISAGSGLSLFHQHERENWIYHLEPSLGIFFQDNRFAQYNLAFSNNVNYPSLHELFSSSRGNPLLKEESAWKFEISTLQPFAVSSTAGKIDVSLFYNIIEDMVDLKTLQNYSQIYDNIDQVQSYGLEAAFKLNLISEHYFAYRLLDYTKSSDRPLNENPRNNISFSEKIMLPGDIFFVYDASWFDLSTSSERTLPAYWLHNFSLNRTFTNFKMKIGLDNAFDTNYQNKFGYPQPGRNFVLALETKLL